MLKRKLWTEESMAAAVEYVKTGHPLHEGSRLYNVPVDTMQTKQEYLSFISQGKSYQS